MTSRDRVLAAVNHQQPDRVPVDFGGHRASGIMAIAYAKLKKYLGIHTGDIFLYDFVQQLAIVEPMVLDVLETDVTEMGRGFLLKPEEWQDWILPDGTPCKIPGYIHVEKRGDDWYLLSENGTELGIQKKGCLYFEQIYYPLQTRNIQDDDFSDLPYVLSQYMWAVPHPGAHLPFDPAGLEQLEKYAKILRTSTDRAIIGLFGGSLFEIPQWLFRPDNYFMYIALYPEAVHRFSEKLTEIHLVYLEKWLGAVGNYIDIIQFGDDLGAQQRPLIAPDMYRNYYKPYYQKMWRRVKELADVKIMMHSCGAVEPFLNDLIEAGLDIINPVQINCPGMDAEFLKRKYGDRLCFWGGGCDTQHILPRGSKQDIMNHVQKQVRAFKPNGGFVFQQVHNIMANVPPENIVTMFRAVNNFSDYRSLP